MAQTATVGPVGPRGEPPGVHAGPYPFSSVAPRAGGVRGSEIAPILGGNGASLARTLSAHRAGGGTRNVGTPWAVPSVRARVATVRRRTVEPVRRPARAGEELESFKDLNHLDVRPVRVRVMSRSSSAGGTGEGEKGTQILRTLGEPGGRGRAGHRGGNESFPRVIRAGEGVRDSVRPVDGNRGRGCRDHIDLGVHMTHTGHGAEPLATDNVQLSEPRSRTFRAHGRPVCEGSRERAQRRRTRLGACASHRGGAAAAQREPGERIVPPPGVTGHQKTSVVFGYVAARPVSGCSATSSPFRGWFAVSAVSPWWCRFGPSGAYQQCMTYPLLC
ncbi:hypothetical protein F4561_002221 [Lipingzhangella halophila]|uniref:Uncharacterized protein n=1 Tax=Lipingzhangella halophila TaxID=1783352 RepID=A0A7W7RG68_9ACTN|nr:hypothetical protein [Lipingzhangella halophila]